MGLIQEIQDKENVLAKARAFDNMKKQSELDGLAREVSRQKDVESDLKIRQNTNDIIGQLVKEQQDNNQNLVNPGLASNFVNNVPTQDISVQNQNIPTQEVPVQNIPIQDGLTRKSSSSDKLPQNGIVANSTPLSETSNRSALL